MQGRLLPIALAVLLGIAHGGTAVVAQSNEIFTAEELQPVPMPELTSEATPAPATSRRPARSTGSLTVAPAMIGDFFGSGTVTLFDLDFAQSSTIPSGGSAVGRLKVAENNSPQPRDRLIFNYHFFNDVRGGIGDVNRYTVGIEKLFPNQLSSIEVRVPFAHTLSSDQQRDVATQHDLEFGDVHFALKSVIGQTDRVLLSTGVGFDIPTADDARYFDSPGYDDLVAELRNEAFHLQPFVGILSTPCTPLFWQVFCQLDIPANGNTFRIRDGTGGPVGSPPPATPVPQQNALAKAGVLQDSTLLFIDVGAGYWLYRNPYSTGLTGIAVLAELHYATTLQDADTVTATADWLVTSVGNRFDILNATLGAEFLWTDRLSVRPVMVVPLPGQEDRQFDYEAAVQVNVRF